MDKESNKRNDARQEAEEYLANLHLLHRVGDSNDLSYIPNDSDWSVGIGLYRDFSSDKDMDIMLNKTPEAKTAPAARATTQLQQQQFEQVQRPNVPGGKKTAPLPELVPEDTHTEAKIPEPSVSYGKFGNGEAGESSIDKLMRWIFRVPDTYSPPNHKV